MVANSSGFNSRRASGVRVRAAVENGAAGGLEIAAGAVSDIVQRFHHGLGFGGGHQIHLLADAGSGGQALGLSIELFFAASAIFNRSD